MIWICKRLAQEKIKPPTTLDNSPAPKLKWMHNLKTAVEFEGSCYEQDKTTFAHKSVVNRFIVYDLDMWSKDLNKDFTLGDCLLRSFAVGNISSKHTDNKIPHLY